MKFFWKMSLTKKVRAFGRAEFYRMTSERIKVLLSDYLQREDTQMTRQILNSCKETIDLDCLDKNGNSFLHIACFKGHFDSVRVLVEAGASLNTQDLYGCSALHISSSKSDVRITKLLLDYGADVMKYNNEGELPLDVAATLDIALILVEKMITLGHKELVNDYLQPLKLKKNINEPRIIEKTGQSMIKSLKNMNIKVGEEIFAEEDASLTGCRFRLSNIDDEKGREKVEESSDDNDEVNNSTHVRRYTFPSAIGLPRPQGSILKRSASIGDYSIEKLPLREEIREEDELLEKKSPNRAVTFPSDILCQVCIMDNDYKDLKRLILADKVRDVDKLYANGISALHLAAIECRPKCIEVLVDCGANIENIDPHGWTPLHAAVASGNIKSVKMLCKKGANLCATTSNGETVFDLAEADLIRKYLKMMTIRLVMTPKKHFDVRRLNSC